MTDESAIGDLVDNWAKAVRDKDYDGILANHSPDVLMFDVPPPVALKGVVLHDIFIGYIFI